uniref:Sulfatase-modifying factor enzyme domain-containing protein n=1 Tax=Setaria digitata TaxID=48799 RepID=A0A915PGF9_9BILA
MSVYQEVRKLVDEATWRYRPHNGFDVTPTDTFKQIVSKVFIPVENVWRAASYCKLREMYHPNLGEYRRSKSFCTLAPSNGMPYEDRDAKRYFGPFRSYVPKQAEWKFALEKYSKPRTYRRLNGVFGTGALFYPSNFIGEEDRRYERIYWGQGWMDYMAPTSRHAASLLLTAY